MLAKVNTLCEGMDSGAEEFVPAQCADLIRISVNEGASKYLI